MKSDEHSCALRALTLCDGQVLEEPDRGLSECLCAELCRLEDRVVGGLADEVVAYRQELIERTMAAPPLPLPSLRP